MSYPNRAFDRIKSAARSVLPGSAWSMLRLAWSQISFGIFKRRVVRHMYGGYTLSMELVDIDGARWYDHDWAAFSEIDFLRECRLRPGARVLNVGANQCLQAMVMAKVVGVNGYVLAVEPNERNAQAARRNLELNAITNCSVIEAAASNQKGCIEVNRAMNGQVSFGWRIGTRRVEAVTIDELAEKFGAPDVLYIDIEGFECAALEGAQETLRIHRPDCFVEVHTRLGLEHLGGSVDQVMSFFPRSEYRIFATDGVAEVFVELTDTAKLPDCRFYLVAVSRAQTAMSEARDRSEVAQVT